jgi:mannosyltransferase
VGGLLVFHRLDIAAWFDEAFSYQLSTQPWHVLLGQYTWGSESNMTLYYLILRAWLWVTGQLGIAPTEVVLRAPSAVAAVAAITMVYLLGRRLFGRAAGLIAAGLYATNFLQMILAQDARAYSLQLFLLCLSTYALVSALEADREGARWWAVFVAANVLAVYAGLFSVLVIGAQVAWLFALIVVRDRAWILSRARAAITSLVVTGVLVAPIVFDAAVHGGPTWLPPAHLSDLLAFFDFIGGGHLSYKLALFGMGAVGLVAALAAAMRAPGASHVFSAEPSTWRWATLLLSWAVVPIGVSFALTRPSLNLHLFFPRYLVVSVPPMSLLAGLGVGALRWVPLRAAAAVGLAAVSWAPLNFYYSLAQVQDFNSPMAWVEQRYKSGDGIACYPEVQCSIPVGYYIAKYGGPAHMDPDSPGLYLWDGHVSLPVTPATLQLYSRQHNKVFFIFGPLSRDEKTASAVQSLQVSLAQCLRDVVEFDAPATSAMVSVYEYEGPILPTCSGSP